MPPIMQINHYNFPVPTANSIDWISIAVSILASLATIALATVTYKNVKENITDRRLRAQPNIVVDFEVCGRCLLQLVVKNISFNPAYDVNISIYPSVDSPFEHIDSLSPNVEMRHTIAEIRNDALEEITDKNYVISIEYTDLYQKRHPKIDVPKNITALLSTYKDAKVTPEDELRKDIKYLADTIERFIFNKH